MSKINLVINLLIPHSESFQLFISHFHRGMITKKLANLVLLVVSCGKPSLLLRNDKAYRALMSVIALHELDYHTEHDIEYDRKIVIRVAYLLLVYFRVVEM